ASAATSAAKAMKIKTIVTVTNSGGAARLTSEYRPEARIVALTPNEVTYRRLALYWGVTPILTTPSASINELIDCVEAEVRERNFAVSGEHIIITVGMPVGSGETTNMLKLHRMP